MLYDFILINGHDRGSIRPVRQYESSKLSSKVIDNVNTILAQALEATGLLIDEMENATLNFWPAWVEEKSEYDETFRMLLDDKYFPDTFGEIKTQGAKSIAKQILNDFAETEDWQFLFDGGFDDFKNMDFDAFSFIDNRVNNENLKAPIGDKVYVRGHKDRVYIYQGRPSNSQISYGANPIIDRDKVWATDEYIISSDSFALADYTKRMETYPLPVTGAYARSGMKNKYFSREKVAGKVTHEGFGKTQKEAKMNLALTLAFNAIDASDKPVAS